MQRSVAKAQEAYANERWDLADAVQGGSVKIAPPLVIDEEPLRESIGVLEEVLGEAIK